MQSVWLRPGAAAVTPAIRNSYVELPDSFGTRKVIYLGVPVPASQRSFAPSAGAFFADVSASVPSIRATERPRRGPWFLLRFSAPPEDSTLTSVLRTHRNWNPVEAAYAIAARLDATLVVEDRGGAPR